MTWLLGVLIFFPFLTVIIAIHEAGHFFAARHYGMKVTEYFVGFGPWKLWSRRKGELEVRRQGDLGRRLREDRRDEPVRGEPARGCPAPLRRQATVATSHHDLRRTGHPFRARGADLRVHLLLLRQRERPDAADRPGQGRGHDRRSGGSRVRGRVAGGRHHRLGGRHGRTHERTARHDLHRSGRGPAGCADRRHRGPQRGRDRGARGAGDDHERGRAIPRVASAWSSRWSPPGWDR